MKTKFLNLSQILLCALFFLSATIFSGCFRADNKFYRDSDIITDSNFAGTFTRAIASKIKEYANCSLVIESATNHHYIATYHEAENWVKFDAVFFRLGTNTFVDIHHLANSGERHNIGSNLYNYDFLSGEATQCEHWAVRVVVKDNQMEFYRVKGDAFFMRNETSEMKTSFVSDDPGSRAWKLVKFSGSTEELRNFLITHASDGDGHDKDMSSAWVKSDR